LNDDINPNIRKIVSPLSLYSFLEVINQEIYEKEFSKEAEAIGSRGF